MHLLVEATKRWPTKRCWVLAILLVTGCNPSEPQAKKPVFVPKVDIASDTKIDVEPGHLVVSLLVTPGGNFVFPPGSAVDLVVFKLAPGSAEVKLIVRNLKVLATDTSTQDSGTIVLTLMVTLEQAEQLAEYQLRWDIVFDAFRLKAEP